jgi:hypothetical protein
MDAGLLDAVMGPIWAALGAIGHKALADAEDEVADGTVRLGRRLLLRLVGPREPSGASRPQLEAAAGDVATDPDDADFCAALRGQVRKALSGDDGLQDPQLASDLTELLEMAGVSVTADGTGAVAVGLNNGIISTGDSAYNSMYWPR